MTAAKPTTVSDRNRLVRFGKIVLVPFLTIVWILVFDPAVLGAPRFPSAPFLAHLLAMF